MAKVPKLKLKIDLVELFGESVKKATVRQAIGQDIIDTIVSRTKDNKDVNGSPFKKYSKDYINSLKFKAFGKTEDVDMTLSGDMLSSMQVIKTNSNTIEIGFDDELNNAKAYNHNFGDTVPKREFFDITNNELESIKDKWANTIRKSS